MTSYLISGVVISAARESLPPLPPSGSRPEERGSKRRREDKQTGEVEGVKEEEAPT